MKGFFYILLFLSTIQSSIAGELVLSGSYQGEDLFVRNPYNRNTKSFCTNEVYVNDRKIFDQPRVSAFKIDLSYLNINDLVVVRITYDDGCEPKVVNPQVLQNPSSFRFLSAEVDNNSIRWMTLGEAPESSYLLEHNDSINDWYVIETVNAKGGQSANLYAVAAPHTKGENKYRIRYKGDGQEVSSVEMFFTRTDALVTFKPRIASTTLFLSDESDYEIIDFWGKIVKEGRGKEINILDLKPGEYYINLQNRKQKFVKR